jgi:NAD(P)-dependent dehydrogenase (short-subunit alcohol dehydrogenase family)
VKTLPFKVALITGAASGIGAALAELLSTSQCEVVLADLDFDATRDAARRLGVHAHAVLLDVTSAAECNRLIEQVVAQHGRVDLVVNCAGIANKGKISELPMEIWKKTLEVNLLGTLNVCLAAYSQMRTQRSGYIVNLSSMSVFFLPPFFAPYITSKAAIFAFSRALALEAEANGVSVTVACPGNVRTPMLGNWKSSALTPAISAKGAAKQILRASVRRSRIAVFPFYAKVFWWLDRIHPGFLNPLRRAIFKRS